MKKTFWQKLKHYGWQCFRGAFQGGSQTLKLSSGVALVSTAGAAVPAFNWKQMLTLFATAAVWKCVDYCAANPLPDDEEEENSELQAVPGKPDEGIGPTGEKT